MKLTLTAPITTWDEALPLGNGLLGGLLWGEGGTLRLSLDRGDLWDERPAPGNPLKGFTYAQLEKLVAAKDNAGISKIVDGAYFSDYPTKIPAGRLELDLAPLLGGAAERAKRPDRLARRPARPRGARRRSRAARSGNGRQGPSRSPSR